MENPYLSDGYPVGLTFWHYRGRADRITNY